ncbi:hypothetical protein ACIQNG_34240 [Streptomyces sp. NPDC091377]
MGTHDWAGLRGVDVITSAEVRGLTDHSLIVARFGLEAVRRMLTPTP